MTGTKWNPHESVENISRLHTIRTRTLHGEKKKVSKKTPLPIGTRVLHCHNPESREPRKCPPAPFVTSLSSKNIVQPVAMSTLRPRTLASTSASASRSSTITALGRVAVKSSIPTFRRERSRREHKRQVSTGQAGGGACRERAWVGTKALSSNVRARGGVNVNERMQR